MGNTPRTRRAIALWLLVLAQLGAAGWLGQRFWQLRSERLTLDPYEGLRQVREGCASLAGACRMDPLLLAGGQAAIEVLSAVRGGDGVAGELNGAAREVAILWLGRDECLLQIVAGGDDDPTTYDIPANLSSPFPGLPSLIATLREILAAPEESVAVRRAALATLQRCAPEDAGFVASDLLERPDVDPALAADARRVQEREPLPLHERSALAALLRLPHESCPWNPSP